MKKIPIPLCVGPQNCLKQISFSRTPRECRANEKAQKTEEKLPCTKNSLKTFPKTAEKLSSSSSFLGTFVCSVAAVSKSIDFHALKAEISVSSGEISLFFQKTQNSLIESTQEFAVKIFV